MIPLEEMEELGEVIDSSTPTLMYFWRSECEECPKIERRLERLLRKYPPMTSFNVLLDNHPMAASRFGVFTPPAVVLYVDRKMVLKQMPKIDFAALESALDKVFTV